MSVVDDLRVARAMVEKGWTKGVLGDHQGNVCAMGAVSLAAGMTIGSEESYTPDWKRHCAQYDALMLHIPLGYFDVASFNDAPETTKEDVLMLFEKAIADLGGLAA